MKQTIDPDRSLIELSAKELLTLQQYYDEKSKSCNQINRELWLDKKLDVFKERTRRGFTL